MKVEVIEHNLIKLISQNDSDKALLNHWSNGTCLPAGSGYAEGETKHILIQFKEKEQTSQHP